MPEEDSTTNQFPVFIKDIHSRALPVSDDVLRNIPIEDLFVHMCETDDDLWELIDDGERYVTDRTHLMDVFGFNTIPIILHNIGNLNDNIQLYNNYLTTKAQSTGDSNIAAIHEMTQTELNSIVKCATALIQVYVYNTYSESSIDK